MTIALIIGISRYRSKEIELLPAAQIDAIHFARALTHWGVSETTLFLNEEATVSRLEDWLKFLSQKKGEYKLLFYFCGHGERETGEIPNSHLLFYDGSIHLDSLIDRFCGLRASETYVFIDACSLRINSLLNPKLEEELKGKIVSHKSFFCLLSSGIEQSFENHQYGYFTDALLKTLAKMRQMKPDCTQFFAAICKSLKEQDLPLPEMYNIGGEKISFLPPMKPSFNCDGLLYRSEMVGKIGDSLILNRGKIGALVGEKGSGKTSLCKFLSKMQLQTFYGIAFPSVPLLETLPFNPLQGEEFAGSLILIDQAETIDPKELSQLVRKARISPVQFLLISNRSFQRDDLFEIKMEPLSAEEGEHLMLPFPQSGKETQLIHLVSRGNPSKMQRVATLLSRNESSASPVEKEETLKTICAIYCCGCYIDKELFANVFNLPSAPLTLFEELGLIFWDGEAWIPHSIFYEIAESESLSIYREASLEYWYQQMRKTPDSTRAAASLIATVKSFEYEKQADPYLKMAFQALSKEKKEHAEVFIEGAQIFESVPFMTNASTLLAEILIDLKRFDLAHVLRQARPKRTPKIPLLLASCFFIVLLVLGFYYLFHTPGASYVNVKRVHPDFVGRSEILKWLALTCSHSKQHPISLAVLWGEGGVGKSEIGIAFANQHLKDFSFIYWIDSETDESYGASYYNLAEKLNIPIRSNDTLSDIVQKVHTCLEERRSLQPWLFIFDNVEKEIELPQRGKGSLIITTRNRSPWMAFPNREILPFSEDEALALFRKITQKEASKERLLLIQELERFPLILNLAAHYIAETPDITEEEYLNLLTQNKLGTIEATPLDKRYPHPILASWQITADKLYEKYPNALHWLHFCSYLCPDRIPISWIDLWLTQIQNEKNPFQTKVHRQEVLRILVNHCLMRYDQDKRQLSIHRLKQEVFKQDKYFESKVCEQVLSFLLQMGHGLERVNEVRGTYEYWKKMGDWELHVAWFLNQHASSCPKDKIAHLYNAFGNLKCIKGEYQTATLYLKKAMNLNGEYYGEGGEKTLISTNNLEWTLWKNGQFEEAQKLAFKSLSPSKKLYGEDHLEVIMVMHHLAWLLWQMGKCWESQQLMEQTLRLIDQKWTSTQAHLLKTEDQAKWAMNLRLAAMWIEEVESNTKKSLPYFKESLTLFQNVFGEDNPRTAVAYRSIGITLNRMGKAEEGTAYIQKAIQIQKKIHGEEHPETAKSYGNLAVNLDNLGCTKEALSYHQKSLEIRKKVLGDEHPETMKSYMYLGNSLLCLKEYKKALVYHQKALDLRIKYLGENHLETAKTYGNLAFNLYHLGKHPLSLMYVEKAVESMKKNLGDKHILTLKMISLNEMIQGMEKSHKELPFFENSFLTPSGKEWKKELKWLENCRKKKPLSVAVLWGKDGGGKSELAALFAKRYSKDFSFWIDCETEDNYRASYYRLAHQLGIAFDQDEFTEELVGKVHSHLKGIKRSWILILDHANQEVELPKQGKGMILITTHSPNLWHPHPFKEIHPLVIKKGYSLLIEQFKEGNLQALNCIHFCSYLCPSGIPFSWIEKELTEDIRQGMINQGVIYYEAARNRYFFHRSIRKAFSSEDEKDAKMGETVLAFLLHKAESLIHADGFGTHIQNYKDMLEWEPHAIWFLNHFSSSCPREKVAALQIVLGNWKYIKGEYRSARKYLEKAVKMQIELFGAEDKQTIHSIELLGQTLLKMRQFQEGKHNH